MLMTSSSDPTPEDFARAEATARLDFPGRSDVLAIANLACCFRASRANEARLEERVRALREAMAEIIPASSAQRMRALARNALKADDAKVAGEQECEHASRETRFEWCSDCGAGPHLLDSEDPNTHPAVIANVREQDRASRRRAYVKKHAPAFLKALMPGISHLASDTLGSRRAIALEQAGLIFDETEST